MSQPFTSSGDWLGLHNNRFPHYRELDHYQNAHRLKRPRHSETLVDLVQSPTDQTAAMGVTNMTAICPQLADAPQPFVPVLSRPLALSPASASWESDALTYLYSETGFRQDLYQASNQQQPQLPPGQSHLPRNQSSVCSPTSSATSNPISPPPEFDRYPSQHHFGNTCNNSTQRPISTHSISSLAFPTPTPPPATMLPFVPQSTNFPNRSVSFNRLQIRPRTPNRHRRNSGHSSSPKKSQFLTLTRASADYIAKLEEHKRECPACQLDFEPTNFIATTSCCSTPMHAVCLSAWVNTPTWARTKACMKCRTPSNIRRMLNKILPAVSDKAWDKGVDLGAPDAFKEQEEVRLEIPTHTSAESMHVRAESARASVSRIVRPVFEHEYRAPAYHPRDHSREQRQTQQQHVQEPRFTNPLRYNGMPVSMPLNHGQHIPFGWATTPFAYPGNSMQPYIVGQASGHRRVASTGMTPDFHLEQLEIEQIRLSEQLFRARAFQAQVQHQENTVRARELLSMGQPLGSIRDARDFVPGRREHRSG